MMVLSRTQPTPPTREAAGQPPLTQEEIDSGTTPSEGGQTTPAKRGKLTVTGAEVAKAINKPGVFTESLRYAARKNMFGMRNDVLLSTFDNESLPEPEGMQSRDFGDLSELFTTIEGERIRKLFAVTKVSMDGQKVDVPLFPDISRLDRLYVPEERILGVLGTTPEATPDITAMTFHAMRLIENPRTRGRGGKVAALARRALDRVLKDGVQSSLYDNNTVPDRGDLYVKANTFLGIHHSEIMSGRSSERSGSHDISKAVSQIDWQISPVFDDQDDMASTLNDEEYAKSLFKTLGLKLENPEGPLREDKAVRRFIAHQQQAMQRIGLK